MWIFQPQLVVIFIGKMMKAKPHALFGTFVGEVYPAHLKGSEARTGRHHNGLIFVHGWWDFSRHKSNGDWDVFVGPNVLSGNLFHSYGKWPCLSMFYQSSCWSSINGPSSSIFAIGQKKPEDLSILPMTWPRRWDFRWPFFCPAGGTRSEREETFSGWADLGWFRHFLLGGNMWKQKSK